MCNRNKFHHIDPNRGSGFLPNSARTLVIRLAVGTAARPLRIFPSLTTSLSLRRSIKPTCRVSEAYQMGSTKTTATSRTSQD